MALAVGLVGGMVLGSLLGGGGGDRKALTQTIKNGLKTDLKNITENTNKILLENVINITNEVINKAEIKTDQYADTSNIVSVANIIMKDRSKFKINQENELNWKVTAAQTIITNANVRNDLQAEITNSVLNKTINQNETLSKLNAVNDLLKRSTDEGGEQIFANMVDKITEIFKPGKTTSEEINQIIENELSINILNQTINRNEVANIIKSEVKNIIESITTTTCNQLINVKNAFFAKDIILEGDAEFDLAQKAITDAVSTCINTATNSVDIANAIIQKNDNFITNDTSNKNKVTADMDVKNKITAIDEKTSVINGLWKSLQGIVIAIIAIAIIGGVIFLFMKKKKTGSATITPPTTTTTTTSFIQFPPLAPYNAAPPPQFPPPPPYNAAPAPIPAPAPAFANLFL